MRIWDLPAKILCTKHLLLEHEDLHSIWEILFQSKKVENEHPEVRRWIGKTKALYKRHEAIVKEMEVRGQRHTSPLDKRQATGDIIQRSFINTPTEQRNILKEKKCKCIV